MGATVSKVADNAAPIAVLKELNVMTGHIADFFASMGYLQGELNRNW